MSNRNMNCRVTFNPEFDYLLSVKFQTQQCSNKNDVTALGLSYTVIKTQSP
jgi:hypothetical protein